MNTEKRKQPKWNVHNLTELSKQYTSRSDFAYRNKPAYEAARLLGIIDNLFGYELNQWSRESVIREASKYKSRTEMASKNGAAYNAARRLKILDELFTSKLLSWNEEDIRKVAALCSSKNDLKKLNPTAYNAALRLCIVDDLFPNTPRVRSRDCVYIWRVLGEQDIYKVGITSFEFGDHRIHQVAKEAKVTPEIIFNVRVGYENAKVIERKLKRMGSRVMMSRKFYGHSEFRRLTTGEIETAVKMVKEYRKNKSNNS